MLDVCGAPADAPGTQLDRRWKLAFTNPAIQRCFLDADAIQYTNKSKNLKSHFSDKKWPIPYGEYETTIERLRADTGAFAKFFACARQVTLHGAPNSLLFVVAGATRFLGAVALVVPSVEQAAKPKNAGGLCW